MQNVHEYNWTECSFSRQQCRAREEAERRERTLVRDVKVLQEKNERLEAQIEELLLKVREYEMDANK